MRNSAIYLGMRLHCDLSLSEVLAEKCQEATKEGGKIKGPEGKDLHLNRVDQDSMRASLARMGHIVAPGLGN